MKKLLLNIRNSPPGKKYLFYSVFTLFCILLVVIIALSVYLVRVYYIKTVGINLVPSKNHLVQIRNYYRQNDPQWQDDKIGTTQQKMGSTGQCH